jgi:outer membrane receptor for ferrienterochelin and colicins
MRGFLFLFSLLIVSTLQAQRTVTFVVRDIAGAPLPSVTVRPKGIGARQTDTAGRVSFPNLVKGQTIHVSSVGHLPQTITLNDPMAALITIVLASQDATEEEVIVSFSRSESRIENLPTKVEVLGLEEVEEEAGVKPGNIGSLLGDVAGIQSQQTSAVSGAMELRVQGLAGKYTQLLRDGLPLFGDFAGSFSILQIPPLDLKQVEIVKGATSTLYGGGAIAGMINLVSKQPKANAPENSVLLNLTTLNEANANLYFSRRKARTGYTFFAGITRQGPADVNKDGFSDVARTHSYFVHPVLYVYPSEKTTVSAGYNGTFEKRTGGDMSYLRKQDGSANRFFISNDSRRHTADVQLDSRLSASKRLTVKAVASAFNRTVGSNTFGGETVKARQFSYYSELAYVTKTAFNDLVLGANFNGTRIDSRSAALPIPGDDHQTVGLFAQNDWRVAPKLTVQTGLRTDFNSRYGAFVLPRLSILYRISPSLTSRIGGGLGYKIPGVFEGDVDERDYPYVRSFITKAERSAGGNVDVNYHRKLGDATLTVNQSFFITRITNAVVPVTGGGYVSFYNTDRNSPVISKGAESYVQVNADELEIYLGYTLTDAVRRYQPAHPHVPLSARNKFASVVSYEFSKRFRACVEAAATGRQFLEDGTRTPAYLFAAAMVRYDIGGLSLVLNCENLLDYRQPGRLYDGTPENPQFRDLWAPIDGRVVNLSARLRWR